MIGYEQTKSCCTLYRVENCSELNVTETIPDKNSKASKSIGKRVKKRTNIHKQHISERE